MDDDLPTLFQPALKPYASAILADFERVITAMEVMGCSTDQICECVRTALKRDKIERMRQYMPG